MTGRVTMGCSLFQARLLNAYKLHAILVSSGLVLRARD